ncbi:PLAC8-domain-containing protein [Trichodelitschia bisporula]|uniref:PLAC8-domain-containing protein n=1 Tax=Trichodelitschia bisporula TaxID=703511 RepID=A0A6G1HSS1_9PEZI|nr:PLAC8-domain-containing protein [Trichodelitschia bisporula]
MAAPAPAPHAQAGPTKPGPVDHADVESWKARFNEVLAKPDVITAPGPADAREWNAGFFGCCNPIDTCLITWCLPCVTFGKTHHRTRKHAGLEGYEAINTSCLLFTAAAFVGLHWIPASMQRSDIRRKYHLQGNCLTDIASACCCALCDLVQQEKEAEFREAELGKGAPVQQQYGQHEGMEYAKH